MFPLLQATKLASLHSMLKTVVTYPFLTVGRRSYVFVEAVSQQVVVVIPLAVIILIPVVGL